MGDSESASRSENVLGQKWDQCVSDTLLKVGGGVGLGVVLSVFLFKKKMWPVHLGGGIGLGMGLANCNHVFKDPYYIHGHITKVIKEKSSLPEEITVITTEAAAKS